MMDYRHSLKVTGAEGLSVGDEIEFLCNGRGRGGHYSVTAVVTKVNRKTVKATEKERSYRPGTQWTITVSEDSPVWKKP